MSANGTEGYLLLLSIDLIQETLVSKGTIIGVIVLDGVVSLRHHLLKSLHCKDSLIDSKISHQMNVDEIADVVTEGSTSPNLPAC